MVTNIFASYNIVEPPKFIKTTQSEEIPEEKITINPVADTFMTRVLPPISDQSESQQEPVKKQEIQTNQKQVTNHSSNGKFSNKNDFIKALNQGYKKALSEKGLDPNYSYILTAQAAMESGWGKHVAGNFNFSGIKITDKEATKNPEKANRTMTTDWEKGKGLFKQYQNFRNFSSIDDYCRYRINLLSNNRYNAFNTVSSKDPYNFTYHILSKGYGSDYGGPLSKKYASDVVKNYNTVLKVLTS